MRWRMLALTAAVYALVGACGAGGDPGNKVASLSDGATPSNAPAGDGRSDEDKMRDYTKCMREHGIEATDAENNPGGGTGGGGGGEGGGGVAIQIKPGQEEALKEAEEACRPLMPNGGQPRELDPAELDKQREVAKCMREHGVDVQDPTPSDPGIKIESNDSNHEAVEKAMKECNAMGPGGSKSESTEGPR